MYIRADHLSQGQTNGFPTYRMKWQGVGSVHRRFSGCMKNIRAKPFKKGEDEFLSLELYTAGAAGPAHRNASRPELSAAMDVEHPARGEERGR